MRLHNLLCSGVSWLLPVSALLVGDWQIFLGGGDGSLLKPTGAPLDGQSDAQAVERNITFDDIDTGGRANSSLTASDLLLFERFELLNTTAAVEAGILDSGDADCATSKPNAIARSSGQRFAAPSFLIGNRTALQYQNLSDTFDFRGLSIKPLGYNDKYTYIVISAWEIDHEAKVPRKHPYSLFISWGTQSGHLRPITVQPRQFFAGWGEGVNWIEVEARAQNGTHLDFCMDNVLLDFYFKDKDGRDEDWAYGFHDGLGPVAIWDMLY